MLYGVVNRYIFEEHGASIFYVPQSKKSGLLLLRCQTLKMEEILLQNTGNYLPGNTT
jgi:hypothetical protein